MHWQLRPHTCVIRPFLKIFHHLWLYRTGQFPKASFFGWWRWCSCYRKNLWREFITEEMDRWWGHFRLTYRIKRLWFLIAVDDVGSRTGVCHILSSLISRNVGHNGRAYIILHFHLSPNIEQVASDGPPKGTWSFTKWLPVSKVYIIVVAIFVCNGVSNLVLYLWIRAP